MCGENGGAATARRDGVCSYSEFELAASVAASTLRSDGHERVQGLKQNLIFPTTFSKLSAARRDAACGDAEKTR